MQIHEVCVSATFQRDVHNNTTDTHTHEEETEQWVMGGRAAARLGEPTGPTTAQSPSCPSVGADRDVPLAQGPAAQGEREAP